MYISCPNCKTNFVVTAQQIGPNGRNVRCSKCNHAWHTGPIDLANVKVVRAEPVLSSNIPFGASTNSGTTAFRPGVNLPALLPNIRIPIYLYILPLILASLIILIGAVSFQEKLSLFGLAKTSDLLQIRDVGIDFDVTRHKMVANYKIVNDSGGFIMVPMVRIRLYDSDNRILSTQIIENPSLDLAPKQYAAFQTVLSLLPQPRVKYMDITLGNRLDFLFR